jgi:acetyltransferase-like isoleucine patch superfamily enzyme
VSQTDRLRVQLRALSSTAIDRGWDWIRRRGAIDAESPLARRYGSVGVGSYIAFPRGDCTNAHAIHLGENCFVGAGVTLAVGMPTEVYAADCDPVIVIGDRTTVGKDCWFVARHSIVLGPDCTIAPNVYFTDHNHTYADIWLPVGQQILQGDPVRVGAGTWIGTNVVVLPGANIGRNCAIAAGAVVRGDIPDHSVVAGVPGRVVRRWIDGEGWVPPLSAEVVVPEGWPVGVPPTDDRT